MHNDSLERLDACTFIVGGGAHFPKKIFGGRIKIGINNVPSCSTGIAVISLDCISSNTEEVTTLGFASSDYEQEHPN